MKVIIWCGCFLIATGINVIIGYAIGIRAGAVVMYLIIGAVARALCKKWDEHKAAKKTAKSNAVWDKENSTETVNILSENAVCNNCGAKLLAGSRFCANVQGKPAACRFVMCRKRKESSFTSQNHKKCLTNAS